MIKSNLILLSVASLLGAGAALAEVKGKLQPGTGPTEAMTNATPTMTPSAQSAPGSVAQGNCTQAELTALISKAGALIDKDKQKMTMGHIDLAKKSMDLKDVEACQAHITEAMADLGIVKK